jgi:hypothetical protein
MDGVAVLRALLIADPAIAGLVPATRIAAGVLPQGTPLDALSIMRVSAGDRNIIKPGATRHVTERVQVTALAGTYPRLRALIKAVKAAAADYVGAVGGLSGVTVHTDSAGPDFMDEQNSIYMSSQDFAVGYTEVR